MVEFEGDVAFSDSWVVVGECWDCPPGHIGAGGRLSRMICGRGRGLGQGVTCGGGIWKSLSLSSYKAVGGGTRAGRKWTETGFVFTGSKT